ncbi:hypothetical protein B0T25DRAFT_434921, partial [Lasiosphaeria hispida]
IATRTNTINNTNIDKEAIHKDRLDKAYAYYQSALKDVFQNIQNHLLEPAYISLLEISNWLLLHVVELDM